MNAPFVGAEQFNDLTSLYLKNLYTSFYILCNFPFIICESLFLVDVNDV